MTDKGELTAREAETWMAFRTEVYALSREQMEPSRAVLDRYGNMSSASIMFVMKELLDTTTIETGDLVCAIGFGPGLTMEVALFEGI